MRFDKCIHLCNYYHHRYISLPLLKFPFYHLVVNYPHNNPQATTHLPLLMSFAFARISYKFTFVYLLLFNMFSRVIHVVTYFSSLLLLLLSSIPVYGYIIICFIHLLMDIWIICSFWLLQIKILWTFMYNFWSGIHFYFSCVDS